MREVTRPMCEHCREYCATWRNSFLVNGQRHSRDTFTWFVCDECLDDVKQQDLDEDTGKPCMAFSRYEPLLFADTGDELWCALECWCIELASLRTRHERAITRAA